MKQKTARSRNYNNFYQKKKIKKKRKGKNIGR